MTQTNADFDILRPITYSAGGLAMTGYLADGSRGAPAPGVLIAHEGAGLDDNVKRRAVRLAELGFVAFALDLYGAPPSLELAPARHAELMNTQGLMFDRSSAALAVLQGLPSVDQSKLAAIGFCQGGIVALELARNGAPIRCAVGFHPGLSRPAGSPEGPIAARVLMMVGAIDPLVPAEQRNAFAQEMSGKCADWQLHVFGGVGHSYTNPAIDALNQPGFRYDEKADRRAWRMMLDLFNEDFAG